LEKIEMKKTLVAVAALVATGAFAQVTISGLVDVAVTVNGTDSTLGAGPNGGSEFTLGVTEDMGNGLKAHGGITLITNIVGTGIPATGATGDEQAVNMYNSFVGLSGDFGSLKLGSQWSPVFLVSTIGDATGRWNSSGLANPNELQNGQSLTYTSPSMAGVSLSFQRQLGVAATAPSGWIQTGGGTAQSYSLTYSAGAFNIAYGNSTDADNGDTTIFAANYDFGAAKITYANLTTDYTGTAATGNQIGISAPFGALTVGAQFSSNGDSETASSYFANYAVSKRTMAYLSSRTATTGTVTTQVGLRHAF
jgi:hypothetical protein